MRHFKHIICRGCQASSFRVAIAKTERARVILDCFTCKTRSSIPIESFDRSEDLKTWWDFLAYSDDYDVAD